MVGTMTPPSPLGGVMVLDFTQIEMGPCATQVLGDFGADVVKIERPGAGDLSRVHMKHASGESAVFWSLNRNKRSVAVDVRSPLGREAIFRLARKADVLVHNFRPGVMERLGFGYDALSAMNPRLIYAFGSGYGPAGPYRDKGGQDVLAQAMSGIASRRADPDAPPEPSATPIADFTGGMLLVQAILLALLAREKTGRGQLVHVSLLDGMLAMQLQEASAWLNLGERLNWGSFPLSGTFRTLDGHVVMVGAFKPKMLRLTAKYADWWNVSSTGVPRYRRMVTAFERACAEVGRDPASIERTIAKSVVLRDDPAEARAVFEDGLRGHGVEDPSQSVGLTGSPAAVAAEVRPYAEIGFDHLIVALREPFDHQTIERLPELRAAIEGDDTT
jgi:crotonobetainyl-CoA:carnitine CoA-transferase CaiB-like acyl-CoA transferase